MRTRLLLIGSAALGLSLAQARAQTSPIAELHVFTGGSDGSTPSALIQDKSGNLFGTTFYGGDLCNAYNTGCGTIFSYDPATQSFSTIYTFANSAQGENPVSAPALFGNTLYGLADQYPTGSINGGVMYSVNTDGSNYKVVHQFRLGIGNYPPIGNLVTSQDGGVAGAIYFGGRLNQHAGLLFLYTAAGDFVPLHNFNAATDGEYPNALLRDASGNLYGSTQAGGACDSCGTVFEYVRATRSFQVLYQFQGQADAEDPKLGAVGPDGSLYGTTLRGTPQAPYGTLFTLKPVNGAWQFTTLANFSKFSGGTVTAPTLAPNGDILGTFSFGLWEYHNGRLDGIGSLASLHTNTYFSGPPVIGAGGVLFGGSKDGGDPACNGCGFLYSDTVPRP